MNSKFWKMLIKRDARMTNDPAKIADILQRAEAMLTTARQGLADLLDTENRSRRITGLHNLIVFGRTVSFVVQNLSSAADGFDEWYASEQAAMRADPLMRFMNDARTEILKQGKLNVHTSAFMSNFSEKDIPHHLAPPGATGFFIGDRLGGSGWEVELPGGATEKYYVEIPAGVTVQQHFSDIPTDKFPELEGLTVDDAAKRYLDEMSALIKRARARFLPSEVQKAKSHLRLVKG
jgi:hypothetical protein